MGNAAANRQAAPLIVILGPRGSGKSVLMRTIARRSVRRVIIDPLGEHGELGTVVDAAAVPDMILDAPAKPLALVTRISSKADGADIADASLALRAGVLLVDEADRWVGPANVDPMEPWIEHVERGRHYGVGLVLTTRRSTRLWRTATANADMIFAFRTNEPRDVAYIKDYAGGEAVAAMAALGEYEFIHIDSRTGAVTNHKPLPLHGGASNDLHGTNPQDQNRPVGNGGVPGEKIIDAGERLRITTDDAPLADSQHNEPPRATRRESPFGS